MTENLAGRGEGLAGLVAALSNLYHAVSGVGFGHDTKAQKQRLADALKEAGTLLAALEAAAPPSTPSKSFYDHVPPDRADIEKNKAEEPHGERLRAELEDWLDRNGIVSMRLDTQNHCVSVDIAKLPPEIKSVLRLWGSIYVERAALATPSPQAPAEQSNTFSPTSAREQFKELFYEAFTEDRDAEANGDQQTLGQRCIKYAAKAVELNPKGATR